MSELEWFSTKRNPDGSFSILVPKDWPESIKHKALDAIELGIQAGAEKEQERIIKLLREKAKHLKQVSRSIGMDPYMSEWDAAAPENGAFYLNEFADALIKGESKPFITTKQAEELTNEMLEE